ncbi:MAG: site-specific integrase [Muribaculaceae bacterium]|nr:site-specific integrase [Muribaculaceae bacterium]
MLKKKSSARIGINNSHTASLDEIKQFTFPKLRENKEAWYIEFYAYDPLFKKMRRKRIKINRIKSIKERRKYAHSIIQRLTQQLITGWNPWIEQDTESIILFKDVLEKYSRYNDKMFKEGIFRELTHQNHYYRIKKLLEYNENRIVPITYLYQMDLRFCNDFLDYIFVDLGLSGIYRNACLTFLKTLLNWCIEKGYTKSNPAQLISPIPKKLMQKRRKLIPSDTIKKIAEWLLKNDRHFLFSCYLLYYCCIRPIEQTRLKLYYFNLKESTLTIPAEDSKNRTTQTITIPRKVIEYALDIRIFNNPPDYYLFSDNLEPGSRPITARWLTEHWQKMSKALRLDKDYTFYSLKDTGITEMLNKKVSNLAVRDQARHSSLAITDTYTRHLTKANKEMLDFEGSF